MGEFHTVSPDNLFSFTCPIFNAQVQMRGCVHVREKVYRGENFPQRRGCQAVISGGKCPASVVIQKISMNQSDATDHCSSTEEKVGRLPSFALEGVRNTLLTEAMLHAKGQLTAQELDLIETANARIDAQLGTAPQAATGRQGRRSATTTPTSKTRASSTPAKAPAPQPTATATAAASGDLSAAINT